MFGSEARHNKKQHLPGKQCKSMYKSKTKQLQYKATPSVMAACWVDPNSGPIFIPSDFEAKFFTGQIPFLSPNQQR